MLAVLSRLHVSGKVVSVVLDAMAGNEVGCRAKSKTWRSGRDGSEPMPQLNWQLPFFTQLST
jgi:hypothetical protein